MKLLFVHIIAGAIGLVSGAVALYVSKGSRLHRRSGMVFVFAILILSATGVLLATLKLNRGNIMGGGLALYLVITGLLATRRRSPALWWMDVAAMLPGLMVGIAGFTFGFMALQSFTGKLDRYPPPLYFIFGLIALISVAGDIRLILAEGVQGRRRIARHLWRMCFAMFIAAGSFFLGQAQVFPKPIRIFPLLAIPALWPLALMVYWLARILFTKRYPGRA